MYEAREQEEILQELQSFSKSPVSKIEGTFENDVLASNSFEFAKVEVELEQAFKMAFADTASGEYLTMRAAESGVIRKSAVKATGVITVKGTGKVPKGSLFATVDGAVKFITTQSATIKDSGDIPIEAVYAGASGNAGAGLITKIPMSIAGINSVSNDEPTTGGYDEETDEALLERYLTHVRTPGTSGNPAHYVEWALSVPGVGAAGCIRTWNGPDTVKVIIVDSNYQEAPAQLVKQVFDYIESVRPFNAIVTVVSATVKPINVTADVVGIVDVNSYRKAVTEYFTRLEKTSMKNYSFTSNRKNVYVSLAQLGAMLLDCGADDYDNLKLNGEMKNIPLLDEELPSLGTVSLNG